MQQEGRKEGTVVLYTPLFMAGAEIRLFFFNKPLILLVVKSV